MLPSTNRPFTFPGFTFHNSTKKKRHPIGCLFYSDYNYYSYFLLSIFLFSGFACWRGTISTVQFSPSAIAWRVSKPTE